MAATKYVVKRNQWVLVPEVLRAIAAGHNTLDLLLKYFPHTELLTYCSASLRPYTMLAALLAEMRKADAIEYNRGTRKWKIKIHLIQSPTSIRRAPTP